LVLEEATSAQKPETSGIGPGGIDDLPEQLTDIIANATRGERRNLRLMNTQPLYFERLNQDKATRISGAAKLG
jgi:hypothetical protein